jgi:ppGpp synthetase/RelA/SpoT-type nucleotidyltranferase
MMKIPLSVRDIYRDGLEKYELLQTKVDLIINGVKDRNWHYLSRIKDEENFALKLETGRCLNPRQLEDFFACTLVVENLNSIPRAEKLIREKFDFLERRPRDNQLTIKRPDSFLFDDLRLYVKWKDQLDTKPTGLSGLLFEVQIKTFLQHAWSIATHDLIYKSDEKNWSKERIAYQIKAMLEHAEISIYEAENLSKSGSLKSTDKTSSQIQTIIDLLNDLWGNLSLPKDKKRLAENINNLIKNIGINLTTLKKVVVDETNSGKGLKTLNLSPYAIIVQALLDHEPETMKKFFNDRDIKFKIYLPREIKIPSSIDSLQIKLSAILD